MLLSLSIKCLIAFREFDTSSVEKDQKSQAGLYFLSNCCKLLLRTVGYFFII